MMHWLTRTEQCEQLPDPKWKRAGGESKAKNKAENENENVNENEKKKKEKEKEKKKRRQTHGLPRTHHPRRRLERGSRAGA